MAKVKKPFKVREIVWNKDDKSVETLGFDSLDEAVKTLVKMRKRRSHTVIELFCGDYRLHL